jgi:hypothetical protein
MTASRRMPLGGQRRAQDVLQQRLPSLLIGSYGAGPVQAEAGFAHRQPFPISSRPVVLRGVTMREWQCRGMARDSRDGADPQAVARYFSDFFGSVMLRRDTRRPLHLAAWRGAAQTDWPRLTFSDFFKTQGQAPIITRSPHTQTWGLRASRE